MDGNERHQLTVVSNIDVKLLGPPRGGIGQLPMYRMVRNDLDVPLAIEVGKYPAAQRRNLLPNPSPDWIEQKSRNQHPTERDRGRERSEERRVGKECVSRVDLGGRRNLKKKHKKRKHTVRNTYV